MKVKGFSIRYNPEENCFDTSRFDEFVAHKELVSVQQSVIDSVSPPIIWLLVSYFDSHSESVRRYDRSDVMTTLSADRQVIFQALKAWRRERSNRLGVKPYLILKDAEMAEVCRSLPKSFGDLQAIRGIGSAKAREFGAELIAVIRDAAAAPSGSGKAVEVTGALDRVPGPLRESQADEEPVVPGSDGQEALGESGDGDGAK